MVCQSTLVRLPGKVEAISRSPTNDPDAVAVRVSSQMRLTVLSPPRPLVMSARTTSPDLCGDRVEGDGHDSRPLSLRNRE